MAHRSEVTSDDEPLFTETVSVQLLGRHSLGHTTPTQARDLLGLEKGEQVQVEIYRDGYFVTVVETDGGE